MASGLGFVLVLLGGFVLALSAPTVTNCLSITSNDPNCWSILSTQNRYSSGALGVYLGAIVATLGVIILAGPSAVKLLKKPQRAGPDPKQ